MNPDIDIHAGDRAASAQPPEMLAIAAITHIAADEALLGRLFVVARRVAEQEGLTNGYRCIVNTGPDGGQEVPHLHLHVLGGRRIGGFPGVA